MSPRPNGSFELGPPVMTARARAHLSASLPDGIVAAQHGWWQACTELGLPGYDALAADSANINLAIGTEVVDPVSGAAPHRSYPCIIEKLEIPKLQAEQAGTA